MKTYSKKQGEAHVEEEILDLNDICRLCMGKENDLIPIFNNNNENTPLTLRIMACVALEVFEGDGLPDKICHPCKYQLEKSYNFRKKCESSDSKLKQLLREVQNRVGVNFSNLGNEEEADMDVEEGAEETQTEPRTEEDLVGVAQVTYIPDTEPEDPANITLPTDEEQSSKEACTLSKALKRELTDVEDEDNVYMMEKEENLLDDNNLDVIADAVKATLASQPGLELGEQIQLKINSTEGKMTQVEVTTEDGSVIVMELMTEDANNLVAANNLMTMPQQLEEPEVNEDGELQIFKCPDCPKSFARRIQLKRHSSVHMQQRGFSCGICEKWFPTKSALIRHERIHTGERPFQCDVCQKSFAQKEILFRHLMTHTGQKPYNCPQCPRGFTQKEPLRVHMRTHHIATGSDIMLHYCSLCPKVFCHASGLSRHLVTHTGKTFKCRDCDKSFTDKSSLRRHTRHTFHMAVQ